MWKFKGRGAEYLGTYEYNRAGKRVLKFKHAKSGVETKAYRSHEHAKSEGWRKVS